MKDLIEIVKSVENSGLLLKEVSKTIQNEAKEQKGGFLSMLLGGLDASLLGNILAGKGAIAKSISEEVKSKSQGQGVNRAGEGAIAKNISKKTKLKSVSEETKSKSISKNTKSKSQGREVNRAAEGAITKERRALAKRQSRGALVKRQS